MDDIIKDMMNMGHKPKKKKKKGGCSKSQRQGGFILG